MEERLKMIYDSFADLEEDMQAAFSSKDKELIKSHFFRSHRLVFKIMDHIERKIQTREYSVLGDYFHCMNVLKKKIGSWYEDLAQLYEEENQEEWAEREWFSGITESTDSIERFIQYAHATLKVHNLYVSKDIKVNLERISAANVIDITSSLKRVRLVINSAVSEHGAVEQANYILAWVDELQKAISNREDLTLALDKVPEEVSLEKAIGELEQLIGLDEVKRKIKDITNWVSFNKLRQEQGFKTEKISLHMVFSGNPGTGKTTVARLVANILKAIGVLSKGHLVEVGRSDLVAEYVGQTAIKTMNKIKEAKGGVLFIDEAYSLVRGSASSDFGIEAIDTLVKSMEDDRNNMVVILAGYPNEMKTFIDSNPGLQSRFKNQIEFPDYSLDELMEITNLLLHQRDYIMTPSASTTFRRMVGKTTLRYPETHGNGRLVRNMIEDAIMAKASFVMEQKARNLPGGDLDLLDETIMGIVEKNRPLAGKKLAGINGMNRL
ncbi:ATPase [Neobacillus piezotolerans]|uniref:ATPase n=1 Tax=Neobacillus piezotolerans TaxID=2259171 RepID=A0A3D8GSN9_9BACI|nr:AAA family ATPase [Neobacillus piezotolerans]RDU37086.1 ATPase [Neobacillus piezotolerans]